jgi:hypothetical protein
VGGDRRLHRRGPGDRRHLAGPVVTPSVGCAKARPPSLQTPQPSTRRAHASGLDRVRTVRSAAVPGGDASVRTFAHPTGPAR